MAEIEPFYTELGDRIRKAREQAGLSQATVGKHLGMRGYGVSKIESGYQRVCCHTLVALGEVLSVSPEELLRPSPRSHLDAIQRTTRRRAEALVQTLLSKEVRDG